MNEVLSVFTIDIIFQLVPEVQTPFAMEVLGFSFILCIFVNLMIHMFFIVRGGCRDCKRQRKNKAYLKRYTVWYAALPEQEKENYEDVDEIEENMAKNKGEMRAHSKKKNKFAALRKVTSKPYQPKPKVSNFWAGKLKVEADKIDADKEQTKGNFWGGKLPVKAKPLDKASSKTSIAPTSEEEDSSSRSGSVSQSKI